MRIIKGLAVAFGFYLGLAVAYTLAWWGFTLLFSPPVFP